MNALETIVWNSLKRLNRTHGWSVKNMVGTDEDYYNGTDFVINGIRVDVTQIPKDLRMMQCVSLGFYVADGIHCNAYIKKHNGHQELPEDVIMLYFTFKRKEAHCVDNVTGFLYEMFDNITDTYWDKVDELEGGLEYGTL